MKRIAPILILLVTLAGRAGAGAEFDAANKLYNQGKFAAAAAGYERMVESGAGGVAVFFNLGNAQFKSGQFGRALAAYRQAEKISPRDPDVLANLQFTRNQIGNSASVKPGIVQRGLARLTLNEWTALAAAAVAAWFVLLALGQWRPAWLSALQNYVLFTGLAAALLTAGAAADWAMNHSAKSAVVVTETTVRTGPLEDAQASFTAKDGAELTVLDEREDWLQVLNGQRQTGWVKRAAVRVL
ncbi:MAG: tetratricopeptide repeat protein [Verrucomicrobia bacterium]|nr:tetratricopeptide repeat protein [Verrucomicrobiota bacterium]